MIVWQAVKFTADAFFCFTWPYWHMCVVQKNLPCKFSGLPDNLILNVSNFTEYRHIKDFQRILEIYPEILKFKGPWNHKFFKDFSTLPVKGMFAEAHHQNPLDNPLLWKVGSYWVHDIQIKERDDLKAKRAYPVSEYT